MAAKLFKGSGVLSNKGIMKIFHRKWEKVVPGTLEDIWKFFSRPENLNKLTPNDMDFVIKSDIAGMEMYEGMMILYDVSPLAGIKLSWATEITTIKPLHYFVDEQRVGPFAIWHHEHHFKAVEEGVRMTDVLHYAVPFGPLGLIANRIFVSKRVEQIFLFREQAIDSLFGLTNS